MKISAAAARGLAARGLIPAAAAPAEGTLPEVAVPVPPSANNLFPTVRGRRVVSAAYRAWRAVAHPLLAALAPPAAFPVEVWLTLAGKGVNGRRDVANVEKAVTDALVSVGVLPGDSLKYVTGHHQIYRPDDGPPRVVVRFTQGGEG